MVPFSITLCCQLRLGPIHHSAPTNVDWYGRYEIHNRELISSLRGNRSVETSATSFLTSKSPVYVKLPFKYRSETESVTCDANLDPPDTDACVVPRPESSRRKRYFTATMESPIAV